MTMRGRRTTARKSGRRRVARPSFIVKPSLIFAVERRSSKAFAAWSTLPLLPVPGAGSQRVQPVDIDVVVELVTPVAAAPTEGTAGSSETAAPVGPEALTVNVYLRSLDRL
jgi:hypothetical protein